METEGKLALVRRRTRRRMVFSVIILLSYFAFVLNWTGAGAFLTRALPGSHITGSLLMFVFLILFFLALELAFLWLYRREG
ncbi:DUF485 domain-containing protein [Parahaliea mediterranea]|uniref:DUF485 domain-containing protein n=1 Tax=Parahaliea mediterranea TaxID=651086 RepID=UPI000E2FF31A|nr:DUF485 domain-containing protein [Parahaliea mediterranea]